MAYSATVRSVSFDPLVHRVLFDSEALVSEGPLEEQQVPLAPLKGKSSNLFFSNVTS